MPGFFKGTEKRPFAHQTIIEERKESRNYLPLIIRSSNNSCYNLWLEKIILNLVNPLVRFSLLMTFPAPG